MKAGENVDALLETIMPMIEKVERLEAQRDALLAARDGAMH
jgi:tetrahydromethanopterin S-methyltransferase subunit B